MLFGLCFLSRLQAAKLWDEKDDYSIVNFVEHDGTRSKAGTYYGTKWWVEAATNETILHFLADHFNMKPSQVKIVSEHFSVNKESPLLREVSSSGTYSKRS